MARHDYSKIVLTRKLLTKLFSHITVKNTGYKSDCWLWFPDRPHKYSILRVQRLNLATHRLMYALFVDIPPQDLDCDHLCRVPTCVNPEHIEMVTPHENVMRGNAESVKNAAKTHCVRGHLLAGDNLLNCANSRYRRCRACSVIHNEKQRRQRGVIPHPTTHCKQGHEFTPENTYWVKTKWSPCKQCKTCRREKQAKSRQSRKLAKALP